MCFFGGGSKPQDPPPIQQPARSVDPQIQAARQDTVRRAKSASGSKSTILTTGGGGAETMANRRTLAGRNSSGNTLLTSMQPGKTVLGY